MYSTSELNPYVVRKKDSETENSAYPHYQNASSYLEKGYVKVPRNCRDLKKGYEVDQNYLTNPFLTTRQNDADFYLESGYEIYLPASQRKTEYVCPCHIGRLTPGRNGKMVEGPWIQV